MFSRIKNFLYRHKNKFLIGGGLIGGVVLLSRFAEYKLYQWHNKETQLMIRKQKRRQHYEKTRETANATVLSLSNNISKIVSEELDTDAVLQAIHSQPHNKQVLWEDLKLIGFGRCMASIYTSSLIGTFMHIHLMLLASYSYSDVEQEHASAAVTSQVQEDYLSILQSLIEKGFPAMFQKIMYAVNHVIEPMALNKQLSLEALESILKDITLLLAGEETVASQDNAATFKLTPWSQYVIKLKKNNTNDPEEKILNNMTEELVDIIDADDFDLVMQTLTQLGLNYVLDYVSNFYPPPQLKLNTLPNPATNLVSEENLTNISSEENQTNAKLAGGARPKIINGEGLNHVKEKVFERSNTNLNENLPKCSIPLAKLIPILSGIVHSSLSPAPGHLLQSVLLNEKLENLSFNVYEAFSVGI